MVFKPIRSFFFEAILWNLWYNKVGAYCDGSIYHSPFSHPHKSRNRINGTKSKKNFSTIQFYEEIFEFFSKRHARLKLQHLFANKSFFQIREHLHQMIFFQFQKEKIDRFWRGETFYIIILCIWILSKVVWYRYYVIGEGFIKYVKVILLGKASRIALNILGKYSVMWLSRYIHTILYWFLEI